MNDSRNASNRLLRMKRVVEYQSKIIYFLGSILLALFLTYRLGDSSFTETQNYVLFLLFFSVGLWVTEAVPPFAVGIMIVGFLVFFLGSDYFNTKPESIKPYLNTWSDSVMWLLLGGFFLAEGLKKVGLDLALFQFTLTRFGTRPERLLLGIMTSTAVISMVMSNTATCAMMLATISPLLGQLGRESRYNKALLLGIAASATLGGMGTIIGSPPNAIAVGSLENISIKISFVGWMLYGVPVAAALVWLTWWLLCKKYPAEMNVVDTSFLSEGKTPTDDDEISVEERRVKRRLVLFVLGITALLWLTNNLHGIPVAAISGIPIILLSMLGIINGDDVRQLPWETLMLVAGGLSLGLAIKETGLAAYFIQKLQYLHLNFFLLLISFALVTVALSNVMSNTAAATILTPIASILAPENPVVMPLVIGFCASCAFMLPVSTPPSAIVFSTGYLRQADFRPVGWLIGLVGPLIIILWVLAINLLR